MNMTLEPGIDVSVQKLSERYGVSRTPVREAVVRLQQSGLVEIYPQHKTVVSKIDLDRVSEEWFIRTSLESSVVDGFILRCSDLVLDTMQELINKQKKYLDKEHFREYYPKDKRFHQLLFETAGELLAWKTMEDISSHYNRIRLLHGKINGVDVSIIKEHENILEAARRRDVDSMRKFVHDHNNNLLDEVTSLSKQYPHYFQNNTTKST